MNYSFIKYITTHAEESCTLSMYPSFKSKMREFPSLENPSPERSGRGRSMLV